MSGKGKSLNVYSHHAPKIEWIQQFFKLHDDFWENHSLGSNMFAFFKTFLRHADLIDEKKNWTETASVIEHIGLENEAAWGIILTNLCYSPLVNWYVRTVGFDREYNRKELQLWITETGVAEKASTDVFLALKRLTELPMGRVGMGSVQGKKSEETVQRRPWLNPVPEVVLYNLYRFAEACGDTDRECTSLYSQFSLRELMDDSIDRAGVGPGRVFGLSRDSMVRILNGLSSNYPEFINVSFSLDLDSISLNDSKTSADVLHLL